MIQDDVPGVVGDSERGAGDLSPESWVPEPPLWLLRHRITVPRLPSGFYHRPSLAARCSPNGRRMTLLLAPGGFGKTTLLAECCHDLLERGVPAGWLTIDAEDEPDMLDTYLAFALEAAGLDVLKPLRSGVTATDPQHPRTAMLLRAVEAHGGPVLLVLDEVERLHRTELVALVNFLVRGAPTNLHLAIAGRELPAGLDVSGSVLGSDAEILTTDDLRFTDEEIAAYFKYKLSQRELASVVSMSSGWPIALRIRENESDGGVNGHARVVREVIDNWAESRLWYNVSDDDREFLLDVGLFEWVDAALLDDVLGTLGGLERLWSFHALDGLLEPGRKGKPEVWQLHPLIREHCARLRRRETPERYCRIHGDIARTLAQRGRTVAAMRHARESGDVELLTTILLDAGGIRLGLREGMDRLSAADRLLPDDAIDRYPRAAMVRCAVLAASGRLADARRLLASVPENALEESTADGLELSQDRCMAQGIISGYGCETACWEEAGELMANVLRFAATPTLDVVSLSAMENTLLFAYNLRASFDKAREHGLRLRRLVGSQHPVMTPVIDIQFGQLAMAQGRVEDAMSYYGKALRLAKAAFLRSPRQAFFADVLIRELDLERNRLEITDAAERSPLEMRYGAQLTVRFAATDVALELTAATRGPDSALQMLEDLWAYSIQNEMPALTRHVVALRVSLLADAGRVEEAQRSWADGALPESDDECIELDTQTWRELESVSCARLRLLMARCEFDAGRRLARAALRVAGERGLMRTAMRVRVLCLKLEHRAGTEIAAFEHLTAFLEMFVKTDYARALVREGEVAATVLERFLKTNADTPLRDAAQKLLAAASEVPATVLPRFSDREMEVLRRLETDRDDDIAAVLGISRHGVRYHVGNIFGKLKVHNRRDAVRRARELHILAPAR